MYKPGQAQYHGALPQSTWIEGHPSLDKLVDVAAPELHEDNAIIAPARAHDAQDADLFESSPTLDLYWPPQKSPVTPPVLSALVEPCVPDAVVSAWYSGGDCVNGADVS